LRICPARVTRLCAIQPYRRARGRWAEPHPGWGSRARVLKRRLLECERPRLDPLGGSAELVEQPGDVDATVLRRVRTEPPLRLLELALAANAVAAAGLVPRDGDVDEALEKVALRRLGRAPRVLQFLVCREELARADQFEPVRERVVGQLRRSLARATLTSPSSTLTS
jgi:hypothetical protein